MGLKPQGRSLNSRQGPGESFLTQAELAGLWVLSWAICRHLLHLRSSASIRPTLRPRCFSATARNHVRRWRM